MWPLKSCHTVLDAPAVTPWSLRCHSVGPATGGVFADVTRLVEDYQVLQRDNDDTATCCVVVPNELPAQALFTVTVTDNAGTQVARCVNIALEPVGDNARAVVIRDLPVGGPYMITVTAPPANNDKHNREYVFRHILVGDIWLMAGQSNMYGSVRIEEELPALPYLNMLNFELIREQPRWSAGIPPIHRYPAELGASKMLKQQYPQATAAEINEMIKNKVPAGGIGPGYFFAKAVYRLVCCRLRLVPLWRTGIPPNRIRDVMVLFRDRSKKQAVAPRGYCGIRVSRMQSSATTPRLSPGPRGSIRCQPTPPNTKNWWRHCGAIVKTRQCRSFWRKSTDIIILPTITLKAMPNNTSSKN